MRFYMVVTNSQKMLMKKLLERLRHDYPEITFKGGRQFYWSPKNREVIYNESSQNKVTEQWSLLHELGHALLEHQNYESDLELVEMESQAWQKAQGISKIYGISIDDDHIQDCLDTYRDWLHQRSACPKCNSRSFQQSPNEYRCFNCGTEWLVSTSRFCRPYRMTKKQPLTF